MNHIRLTLRFLALILIGCSWPAGAYAQKAALVRDADQPARTAFSAACGINTLAAASGSPSCSLGIVPAGSVLVIETVTASVGITSTALLRSINLGVGTSRTYFLAATPTPQSTQGNFQGYTVTQQVRIYAQPGQEVVAVLPSANQIETFSTFTISGHLVSVP